MRKHLTRLLRLTLAPTATLSLLACAPPPSRPDAAPSDAAQPQATPLAQPQAAPADPAITAELDQIKSRHACNRITGCSQLAGLMRHGAALIEPARLALSPKPPDGYWALALIEALGQLDAPEASAVLGPLLADPRWDVQLSAARGLAYLGDRMDDAAVEALRTALAKEPLDTDASHVSAALFEHALARSGRDSRPQTEARASLLRHLPAPNMPPPHPQLDAFVRLVGEARIPEGLPLVRTALHSRNRLVTATALDVAGGLQDTGALPYVLSLLDDPNPTLRREAVRALQRITGAKQLDQAEQWRAWAEARGVEVLALPPAPKLGPQVLSDD